MKAKVAVVVASFLLLACGSDQARPKMDSAATLGPTSAVERSPVVVSVERKGPDAYVSEGGCPFECCRYGDWTMNTPATLRRSPDSQDSLGALQPGDKVRATTGVVIVDPTGIVIISADSLPSHGERLPAFAVGDTLYVLDYHGEGYFSVRWRDQTFAMEERWDSTGKNGARLMREPVSAWWARIDSGSKQGWISMKGVDVSGADACGR